jgi:hypothetical protein
MIYLIIYLVIILILTGCLWLLYKWYRQEQIEQDRRINILETRLEGHKKLEMQVHDAMIETINDYYEELTEEIKIAKRQLKKKNDING